MMKYIEKCINVVAEGISLPRPVTEESFRQICGKAGVDPYRVILLAITGKMGDMIPDYIREDVLKYFMPDQDSTLFDDLLNPANKE